MTTTPTTVQDGRGNIVEIRTPDGQGNETVRTFDAKGQESSVETKAIEGWTPPEAEPETTDPVAVLAARLAAIPGNAASNAVRSELRAIGNDVLALLTPPNKETP